MSGRFYYYGGGGNSPYGWVADLLSPGNREGNDMPGDMPGSAEPPQSRQPNPAAPEPIACDPTLEVKDAVVIEEIDRENRSDNNRKNF